jgi:hypothetical protein
VLLASLDDFPDDVEGRASLYVGCTRAREWLARISHTIFA